MTQSSLTQGGQLLAPTMLPVLVALGAAFIPEGFWQALMVLVPFRVSPYMALFLTIPLVQLPFGIKMCLKIYLTSGNIDNIAPRQQDEKLVATNPMFARLKAAEANMYEGLAIFAPALLAALQAGVSKETVSLFATAWLLSRFVFIVIYWLQTNDALGAMRSLSFAFSLMTTAKLAYMAASI